MNGQATIKKERETIRRLKRLMKDGDAVKISELTEYSPAYVRNCISAERNNKNIWKAAALIIEDRERSEKWLKSKMRVYN